MKKDTLMFIINPVSGGYKESVWEELVVLMDKNDKEFSYYKTKCIGDATRKVQDFIKDGYRHFVGIGGDGTISEIANGFMMQNYVDYDELTLSAISSGTGNDWVRNYGQSSDLSVALMNILNAPIRTQDIGLIHYYENGEHRRKYFLNAAGFGFDSQIIKSTKEMTASQRGHKMTYLYTLLKCLLSSKKINFKITTEDEGFIINEKTLSISVGNGKYTGGGMMQTPDADNTDGLFDTAVYGNIQKYVVIKNVHRLYDGSIKEEKNPHIYHFRSKEVNIETPVSTICEIDGELIGTGPYNIEIIKGALRVRM